ncbi:hypothetical protein B0H19DRAFT_428513 [Mycena capillaripes]|nr:hypothetical protein B0H19DRAFT_428513 [Mycena capillaripes]
MDSPFAQHLHTNYVPTYSEIRSLQTHLIPQSKKVLRLEALICSYSAERDRTLNYIEAHKALISPARRLPADIVQEIFLACLPTHHASVMSAKAAPIILTRICSAWRALALSTPALWASLHLPLEYIFERSFTAPVAEWLARSGRHPLSLSILGSRNIEQWEDCAAEEVDAVMGALVRCADRLHALDLVFNSFEGLLRLGDVYAPALRSIKTKCDPEELSKMKLLTTPSLRSVTIRLWREFDKFVPRLPLRWEYLTSLSFESTVYFMQGLSPPGALVVLKHCPRLVHFETDINNSIENIFASYAVQSPAVLPALQSFVIHRGSSSVGPNSLGYLLQQLEMPQLRRLQLPRTALGSLALPFLGDLAARSPLIEELDIDLAGLAFESLLENLHNLPSLKTLAVLDSDGVQNRGGAHIAATVHLLLQSLASIPDADAAATRPLCPQLRDLRIAECRDLPGGETELLDFVRRRLDSSGSGGCWKTLQVEHKMFMLPIEPHLLAPFAVRGLSISSSSPQISSGRSQSPDTAWTGIDL